MGPAAVPSADGLEWRGEERDQRGTATTVTPVSAEAASGAVLAH
jgi:hypothetical protein